MEEGPQKKRGAERLAEDLMPNRVWNVDFEESPTIGDLGKRRTHKRTVRITTFVAPNASPRRDL